MKPNYFKIVSVIIYTFIYGLGVFNTASASSYTYNVIDDETHTSYLTSVNGSNFVHTQQLDNLSLDFLESCNTSKDTYPKQLDAHHTIAQCIETAYYKQYSFKQKSVRIYYRKHCLFYPFHSFW